MTKERAPTATKDGQKGGAAKDQKVVATAKDAKVEAKGGKDQKVAKNDKDQKGGAKVDAKGAKGEAKEHKDKGKDAKPAAKDAKDQKPAAKDAKDQKPAAKEGKEQKPHQNEDDEDAVVPKAPAAVQAPSAPAPQANTGKMRNVVYQDYMTPNTNKVGQNAKGNKVRREKNKFVASYGDREEQSTPRPAAEKNASSPTKEKKGGKAGVKA